jgi:putative transposase
VGQSLVQNYIHIVFSTKDRVALIKPQYEEKLYAYLSGICKTLGSPAQTIGGHHAHIHILCRLSKNSSLVELIQKIKGSSSKWMKTEDASLSSFYWQDGYGAFSVNPKGVDRVIKCIGNQHEHHCKRSFQEEYRALLEEFEVEYDERYVWD